MKLDVYKSKKSCYSIKNNCRKRIFMLVKEGVKPDFSNYEECEFFLHKTIDIEKDYNLIGVGKADWIIEDVEKFGYCLCDIVLPF